MMEIREVSLDWLKVAEGRRLLDDAAVQRMAESIEGIGLLNPVQARPDGSLIAGNHRRAAYERLGRPTIPCRIMDVSDIDAELAEIDENLVKLPLTSYQEMHATARRKELYEAKYPETRHGATLKRGTEKPTPPSPHNEDSGPTVSFVADTAEKTGRSPKSIERDVRIAKAFGADELETLQKAKIPVLDLDKLASLRRSAEHRGEVDRILALPVKEIRPAVKPLLEIKDTRRTSAGRRQKALTDRERREASLARQTPEQQRARLEAGQMLEVDRLIERIERLTFASCLEKVRAAVCARMQRIEEEGYEDAAFAANG